MIVLSDPATALTARGLDRTTEEFDVTEDTRERWLPVVGYEGAYEVSDLGGVRRVLPGGRRRLRRQCPNTSGYLTVTLSMNNVATSRVVHRLVAAAFLGPVPEGMHTCHCNGDKTDNRAVNLRYDSPTGNQADRIAHGTDIWGERHHAHKLTAEDVLEIWRLQQAGARPARLAEQFGVSGCAINDIVHGRTWTRIVPPRQFNRKDHE